MPIVSSLKIDLGPVLWFCMTEEPIDGASVDCFHVIDCLIEFLLHESGSCVPKQFIEFGVFEFFMKVFGEMTKAISMWATREKMIDALEKPFLTVGQEYERFID